MKQVKQLNMHDIYTLLEDSEQIVSCLPVYTDNWGDSNLRKKVIKFLSGFHTKGGFVFGTGEELNHFNIQAEHWTVEIGFSEFADVLPGCVSPRGYSDYYCFIIAFANYKGDRCISVYRLSPGISRAVQVLLA